MCLCHRGHELCNSGSESEQRNSRRLRSRDGHRYSCVIVEGGVIACQDQRPCHGHGVNVEGMDSERPRYTLEVKKYKQRDGGRKAKSTMILASCIPLPTRYIWTAHPSMVRQPQDTISSSPHAQCSISSESNALHYRPRILPHIFPHPARQTDHPPKPCSS